MGKKYHCDFCDKSFSDNLTSRRRHFQGISHQRNRKNHYDSFRAQIQLEERVKRMSYVHNATGEEVLKSWLANRPDVVKRCRQHGIPVDVAEGEVPYQTSDSCSLQHPHNSRSGYLNVTSQPYSTIGSVPSNVPPSMPPPCPPQAWHQTQSTANQRHSAPLLLQPLSQSPPALFHTIASPMTAYNTHTAAPPHMQSPHPTPPLVRPLHPTPPHMQSPHPTPPHMQSPHPTPQHMQSPHPTPPHMPSSHPTPPHMQSSHPTPLMPLWHDHDALPLSTGFNDPHHHSHFYH